MKLAQGAEAILKKKNDRLVKNRIKKNYRIKQLDGKLRFDRTKKEARLILKARRAGINTPRIIKKEKTKLVMEFLDGEKIKDVLDKKSNKEQKKVITKIAKSIAKLHQRNIIHGDLTTSNMILCNNKIYFIDFGLAFHSSKIEHKAVDLHLLHQALNSTHQNPDNKWQMVLKVYKDGYGKGDKVIKRLKKIEKRGRYIKK